MPGPFRLWSVSRILRSQRTGPYIRGLAQLFAESSAIPSTMSQLLLRLEQVIGSSLDPVERAIASAKRACYLARVGRFSEVEVAITELRAVFGDGRSGRVTAWIMLAEGLLGLFERLSPKAFDRVFRSQFLGVALHDEDVLAVASAWKAHFEFEVSNFEAMTRSLRTVLASASDSSHEAMSRASMVLFNAYMLCGDRTEAQRWFGLARNHSLSSGDQAGIDALIFNRAAFGVAWLRAARCSGEVRVDMLAAVRMEVNSARNLQQINGITAFAHLIDLSDARLLMLEGKFERAIAGLQAVRRASPFADYNFNQALIDLEVGYCWQRLGEVEASLALVAEARATSFSEMDIDDQLVAAWICRELATVDRRLGDVAVAQAVFQELEARYVLANEALLTRLAEFRS